MFQTLENAKCFKHLKMQVHCDATIAFPLLVAATFARKVHGTKSTN
jgi:deoxyhypusine synthase